MKSAQVYNNRCTDNESVVTIQMECHTATNMDIIGCNENEIGG